MAEFFNYLGHFFIVIGLFFVITTIIGLFRFKGFFAKLHATSISDSLGVPLCYIGLALLSSGSNNTFKFLLLALLALVISPLIAHSLAKTAYLDDQYND